MCWELPLHPPHLPQGAHQEPHLQMRTPRHPSKGTGRVVKSMLGRCETQTRLGLWNILVSTGGSGPSLC